MRLSKALIYSLIAASIIIILLIYLYPPVEDFNLQNSFWNGLSRFSQEIKAQPVSQLSFLEEVLPSETVLYIIGPSTPFTPEEISQISHFLKKGGTTVIADDFGSADTLLSALGLKTRFSQSLMLDPLFKDRASTLPRVIDMNPEWGGITSLIFNYPTVLQIDSSEAKVLASSSSFSFLDDNLNYRYDEAEFKGPFVVIARVDYGSGHIYLISDSSIFINSMLGKDDNKKLLSTISSKGQVLIVTSHWKEGRLMKLKRGEKKIYYLASLLEVRYSLLLILATFIFFVPFMFRPKKEFYNDELERVRREHPEWDIEILKMLKERSQR